MAGGSLVWLAGGRDLQWRLRRVAIAVLGAALVFAITLLLSGFRATFDVENRRVVRDLGAAAFVVRSTSDGPFTSANPVPAALADQLVDDGEVGRADPVIVARSVITAPTRTDTYIVAHRPGGLGSPPVSEGRVASASGEAVVDGGTGYAIGDSFELGGTSFVVVGRVSGRTIYFGLPMTYLLLDDVQAIAFGGADIASAVLTDAVPTAVPDGMQAITPAAARADLAHALAKAITTISLLKFFLWCVAAAIIGSVLYIAVLERARDFAVFKAIGVSTRHLGYAIAAQAVGLAVLSAALATAVAVLLRPTFPIPITLPASLAVQLVVVAVVVGLVAAFVGLRRVVRIEPSAAFAGP